jgi:hypothetical protein
MKRLNKMYYVKVHLIALLLLIKLSAMLKRIRSLANKDAALVLC